MTRTVPGTGAKIEPLFNSIFGVRDVYVVDGGSGYNSSDPPHLKISNCGTPIRDAILEPVIENGQIASVKVLKHLEMVQVHLHLLSYGKQINMIS